MQLGMIGLGRMGANLTRRAHRGGHRLVVHDTDAARIAALVDEGVATGADALPVLVDRLPAPRTIWIMVPAAVVGHVLEDLTPLLDEGDVVIDGGNTHFADDIERAGALAAIGVHHVDVGTSGGVWGLDGGYCLMIGGEAEVVTRLEPLFRTLAPGVAAADRTPGRQGDPAPEEEGWLHCGPNGAGHFVKMIHNGIEYGAMAALAEGLNVLARADLGTRDRADDAETAPLLDPDRYRYDLDLGAVVEVWRRGSVVRSWLLDLTAAALVSDPNLDAFDGRVSDSGEGRWAAQAAIDVGVPAPVLSGALFDRFASRGNADTAGRLLSAMRQQFGGHDEKPG